MNSQTKKLFWLYYFRSRTFLIALLLFFYLVLGGFGFLFEQVRAILHYLILILCVFNLLAFAFDCSYQYQRLRKFLFFADWQAQSPMEYFLSEQLTGLQEEKMQNKTIEKSKYNDLLDYYTLWAHQIKTPIAASKLLMQDVSDQPLKKQLEQELFKIDSYTNLVLQYLRLESFHDDLVLRKESLEDMVKEIVKKYAIFFIQQGLTVDLHDLDKTVITDKKWFSVILEQIISNSLKYTRQGGIEIYFAEGLLHIKDSGLGIKDSDVLRVFERGFSGYNGRLTQQSSGLGLYLSKKIADKLGHDLHLQSQVGQGTTVMIAFKEEKILLK